MEYLKNTGYAKNFITIVGKNNDRVWKGYKDSKPGNSPEFSRGCDSFGFPKMKMAMDFNCSLASVYPYGDARRAPSCHCGWSYAHGSRAYSYACGCLADTYASQARSPHKHARSTRSQ